MTPIDKLADKLIIAALLGAFLWMAFSKPVVVNNADNTKLVEDLNKAFAAMGARIQALEGKGKGEAAK